MIRIAVVGAGGIAGRHVVALHKIKEVRIVGIVDINRKNAEDKAKICGARVCARLEDCLDEVDLVYVLTPPSSHADIGVRAIEAGKHVFVEKPITSTVADAERLVAAADRKRVKLVVGFNMRFRAGFKKLKEIADSGKLGKIHTYWVQRLGLRVDPSNKWSTDPLLMTGMSIQSLSHDIDTMRWIAGEVTDVRARVLESRPQLPGFDDNANAVFSLASGGTAVFQASWSSHLAMNTRGVIGTKGTAYIRGASLWDIDAFHWKTDAMEYEQIEVLNDVHDIRSFDAEDGYLIDCLEHGRDPSLAGTGLDGLKALRVSYGILKASKDNSVVPLAY